LSAIPADFSFMAQPPSLSELIAEVRLGKRGADDLLWEMIRSELRAWAAGQLHGPLAVRMDASDLVQNTLVAAQGAFPTFRGQTADDFRAWVKGILRHEVNAAIRRHAVSQKRSVQQQVGLPDSAVLGQQGMPLDNPPSSPSQRLSRAEDVARLLAALRDLPADQEEAIRLHYFCGCSLSQLAEHFGRSQAAVAGLLQRGMAKLRKELLHD
jgi:RNA polymerase sigma-70 factor (ECF subfamily)